MWPLEHIYKKQYEITGEGSGGRAIVFNNPSSVMETQFRPDGSDENPPTMRETLIWPLGLEDTLEEEMQPTPVFLPGEFHGKSMYGELKPIQLSN